MRLESINRNPHHRESLPSPKLNQVMEIPRSMGISKGYLNQSLKNTPKALMLSSAIFVTKALLSYPVLSHENLFFGLCSGALSSRATRIMTEDSTEIKDPLSRDGINEMVGSTPFKSTLVASIILGLISATSSSLFKAVPYVGMGLAGHWSVEKAFNHGYIEKNTKERFQSGAAIISLSGTLLQPLTSVFSMTVGGAVGSLLETLNAAYDQTESNELGNDAAHLEIEGQIEKNTNL